MMILTGKNLGARQQELNLKVKEAAEKNDAFDAIKDNSDIDKLFKIDLAIKLKNVSYIVEVLKCGDRLHISRALRAVWLYGEEFSYLINPQYLKNNIFPFMSLKMRNMFLTKIALYLQRGNRAVDFYEYCREEHLEEISYKFLLLVPESFKLQYMEENIKSLHSFVVNETQQSYIQNFLENSFTLAEAFLKNIVNTNILYLIRHMYSVSDVKYLDLIEKQGFNGLGHAHKLLGLRISKSVMQKHKKRVLEKPHLYISLLNKKQLSKYSNIEDAKLYLSALLPKQSKDFWDTNFCGTYKYIIEIISLEERFEFVKTLFSTAYPEEEFETSMNFVNLKYYDLMTLAAREEWALSHIMREETKGTRDYFKWYKFVSFPKAFQEIKKIIMVTTNKHYRSEVLEVLTESAKTQRDLEMLFIYYYKRHVNEESYKKSRFVNKVLDQNNALKFDEKCWEAFYNILHSLDIFRERSSGFEDNYAYISLLYHVVNGLQIDQKLRLVLNKKGKFNDLQYNRKDILSPEMQDIVYKFLIDHYTNEIKQLDTQPYRDEIQENIRFYIKSILQVLDNFDKTKEQCSEIVWKYVKLDWDYFENENLLDEKAKKITQQQLIRFLKKDSALFVNELSSLKDYIEHGYYHRLDLNLLLRKLKVYFSSDIATVCLQFFKDMLADNRSSKINSPDITNISVLGIFQLADNTFKIDFMAKHAPTEAKIDHKEIDQSSLEIQRAICRFACYSRPPVPLDNIMCYTKGDYVHSSLPIFNMFMANLPLPLCMEFITRLLDTPVSISKHGLRMAFNCFPIDQLNKTAVDTWKKTKNVSLRMDIYKRLFNKFVSGKKTAQGELFKPLKQFTLELNEDDTDYVFNLLTSNEMLTEFLSEYLEAAWSAVSKLPIKAKNVYRMIDVINHMTYQMDAMKNTTIRPIIDAHIKTMLIEKQIHSKCDLDELKRLNKLKWELTASYIAQKSDKDNINQNLKLLLTITQHCFDMWNEVAYLKYTIRKFYYDFTGYLESQTPIKPEHKLIFEALLKDIEESLPMHKRYLHVWKLRLHLIHIDIVSKSLKGIYESNYDLAKESIFKFTREIGGLVKEFIEKGLFFKFMSQSITDIIEEKLNAHYYALPTCAICFDDVKVLSALVLTDIELSETFIIALELLPLNYEKPFLQEYMKVVEKLKAFESPEMQCCFHDKFMFTDLTHQDCAMET